MIKKIKEKDKKILEMKKLFDEILKEISLKYEKEVKSLWILPPERGEKILFGIIINDLSGNKKKINSIEKYFLDFKRKNDIEFFLFYLTDYFKKIMDDEENLIKDIRRCIILYDPSNLMKPIKILIEKGKIRRSKESLIGLIIDIEQEIREAKDIRVDCLSVIYSSVIDVAQAVLLLKGYYVLIPSTLPGLLESFFKSKDITKKTIDDFKKIYFTYKDFEHGKIKDISGKELDYLIKKADSFITQMQILINHLRN